VIVALTQHKEGFIVARLQQMERNQGRGLNWLYSQFFDLSIQGASMHAQKTSRLGHVIFRLP